MFGQPRSPAALVHVIVVSDDCLDCGHTSVTVDRPLYGRMDLYEHSGPCLNQNNPRIDFYSHIRMYKL